MAGQHQVDVRIATTASGDGAAKTEAGLEKVEAQARQTEKTIGQLELELKQLNTDLRNLTPNDSRLPALRAEIDRLEQTLGKAGVGGRNMGNAMLQASRGIQDFQAAGLAGVVNNLEGLASALGLGAGVAGAVTVVAVALQTLGPQIAAWFKSLDVEGVKLDELKQRLEGASKALLGEYSGNKENAKRITDEFTQALQAELDKLEAEKNAIEQQIALLKQRNAIQSAADKSKTEADIEDIKAQGLPPEQEANAIAARRRALLQADKARADDEALRGLQGKAEALTLDATKRDDLNERVKQLEAQRQISLEYNQLLKEELKLRQQLKEAEVAARSGGDSFNWEDMRALEEARAKVEANQQAKRDKIASAPDGRIRRVDDLTGEIDAVKNEADSLARKVTRDAQALKAADEAERAARIGRQNRYERDAEKIERERLRGAPPLALGAGPLGEPAPLPTLNPNVMDRRNVMPGTPPPDPLGRPAPLPGLGPAFDRPPPAPLDNGPAPLPGTESIDQAAASNAAANAEVLKFAAAVTQSMQRITEDNADLKQQIATLSSQIANSRPA